MNRRHWLSLVLASSASSLLLPRLKAGNSAANSGVWAGLFFDPARLDNIRHQYLNHPEFAPLRAEHAEFDFAAETAWMDHDLRYNDQLIDMRKLHRLVEDLAFMALMTDEPRAVELAKRAVREIMKFERWDFFLDGDDPIAVQRASHASGAVCVAIDLLGDRVDPAERREWIQTLWERGCEACFRTVNDIRNPQQVEGWRFDPESTFFEHRPGNRTDMNRRPEITFNTNLRGIPSAALILGTLVYELEFGMDENTERFREMGIWGMEGFRQFFQADGSYDEEVNYANYTATHLVQAIIALRRHGGPDLTDLIDWDAYVEFLYHMSMPTHANPYGVVNWGDSGNPPEANPTVKRRGLPIWIAGETGNAHAQAFAREYAGKFDLWSALWFDASVPAELPENRPQLWVSDLDRVVARTGFAAEHLVVAMRSGPPANHEHGDRNSIIVKCFGQELITDPLRPAYSYSDPAWRMRLTEGHSGILIDGHGHEHHNGVEGTNASSSYARVVEHHDTATYAHWVSDASQPYRLVDTDIKSVVRSALVLYDIPAVVLVDRITKWKMPSTVQARFFGYNWDGQLDLTAEHDGFVMRRPGAVLRAKTFSSSPLQTTIGQMDILADQADRHPFADVSSGPLTELTLVTVMGIAETETALPPIKGNRDGSDFEIHVGSTPVRVKNGALRVG
jgi:hypothetical protein